jgi:hypothetical protein
MWGQPKHKVFISYHHKNDQWAKEHLLYLNENYDIFIDGSVDIGDISDDLSDDAIRRKIRDEYLRDTSVTVLLVGTETKFRKHVLWELYSSMYDGQINRKSGLLVIELPDAHTGYSHVARTEEKSAIFPEISSWTTLEDRSEFERRHFHQPDLIIDNLLHGKSKISIIPWGKIQNNPANLRLLIDGTYNTRQIAEYDLSRPMRQRNFNPTVAIQRLYRM